MEGHSVPQASYKADVRLFSVLHLFIETRTLFTVFKQLRVPASTAYGLRQHETRSR